MKTMTTGDQDWLRDAWTLYFHDPTDSDWSLDSYERVGGIGSIQEFWQLQNELNGAPLRSGMWFIFREHVFPSWDDKANIDGGTLSMKLLKTDVEKNWLEICGRMLGETLPCEDLLDLAGTINGLSISPKRSFCILKLWLASEELGDRKSLRLPKYDGDLWYKANRDVIIANQTSEVTPPSIRR